MKVTVLIKPALNLVMLIRSDTVCPLKHAWNHQDIDVGCGYRIRLDREALSYIYLWLTMNKWMLAILSQCFRDHWEETAPVDIVLLPSATSIMGHLSLGGLSDLTGGHPLTVSSPGRRANQPRSANLVFLFFYPPPPWTGLGSFLFSLGELPRIAVGFSHASPQQ